MFIQACLFLVMPPYAEEPPGKIQASEPTTDEEVLQVGLRTVN
jgi:hypothetical protein